MNYISTRNKSLNFDFSSIFLRGLAPDGGLFLPNEIRKFSENELEELFFSSESEENKTTRICPKCNNGDLGLQLGKYGAFIGCGNYPECRYTRPISGENAESGDRLLGENEGDEIHLRSGRFGPYVQRGEATEDIPKP